MQYVISDLHGDLDSFKSILEKIQFQNTDEMFVLGDVIDDMVREFMEQDVTDVKISEETERKILEMISNIRVKKQKDTATHDTPPRAEEREGDTVHQNE